MLYEINRKMNNFTEICSTGERLAYLMDKAIRIKGTELAKEAGVSTSYISEIKQNRTQPNLKLGLFLQNRYNVNLEWLLEGKGEPFLDGLTPADREALEERRRKGYPPTLGEEIRGIQKRDKFRQAQPAAQTTAPAPADPTAPSAPNIELLIQTAVDRALKARSKFTKITDPGDAPKRSLINIPLHDDIAAGDPRETLEHPDKFITLHPDLIPTGIKPEAVVAVRVHGNSMEPTIRHGSVVFLDTNPLASREYYDNMVCAVRWPDDLGANTIKHLYILHDGVLLVAHNRTYRPTHIHAENIPDRFVIGRVFAHHTDWLAAPYDDDLK